MRVHGLMIFLTAALLAPLWGQTYSPELQDRLRDIDGQFQEKLSQVPLPSDGAAGDGWIGQQRAMIKQNWAAARDAAIRRYATEGTASTASGSSTTPKPDRSGVKNWLAPTDQLYRDKLKSAPAIGSGKSEMMADWEEARMRRANKAIWESLATMPSSRSNELNVKLVQIERPFRLEIWTLPRDASVDAPARLSGIYAEWAATSQEVVRMQGPAELSHSDPNSPAVYSRYKDTILFLRPRDAVGLATLASTPIPAPSRDPAGTWVWEDRVGNLMRHYKLKLEMTGGKLAGTRTYNGRDGKPKETALEKAMMIGNIIFFETSAKAEGASTETEGAKQASHALARRLYSGMVGRRSIIGYLDSEHADGKISFLKLWNADRESEKE